MIGRLAWRELLHHRSALLLQVASLTVAIAALAAVANLRAQTQASAIPGSTCADEILVLKWTDDSRNNQDAWSPRQAAALQQALGSTPSSPVLNSVAVVPGVRGEEGMPVAFVGPQFFDIVCAQRRNTFGQPITSPFDEGLVATSAFAKRLGNGKEARVDRQLLELVATAGEFRGLQHASYPLDGWAPYGLVSAQSAFLDMNVPTIQVVVRPPPDQVDAILARLEAARKAQPGLFDKVTSVQMGPPLRISAWTAGKVRMVTGILQMFAAALLILVLVNLLTYHAGRLPQAQALATTLTALGVPPRTIWIYAAVEPALVAAVAWLGAAILSGPLSRAAVSAVTNEVQGLDLAVNVRSMALAFAVAAAITAVIVFVRGRVLTRQQAPSRSRAQRLLLRWLPLLLTVQVALAAATLALAAQAGMGLLKALPPPPNVQLDGLSMLDVGLTEGTDQANIGLRWRSAWQPVAPAGYQAALANTQAPFLPIVGWSGVVGSGRDTVLCFFSFVTPNFFQVLGGSDVDASAFATDFEPMSSKHTSATHMVLNRLAADALFDKDPRGEIVRVTHDLDGPKVNDRPAVIAGVYDDGIVGARGATGKIDFAQLSMQASVPLVYQSLTDLKPGDILRVFVRHPRDATPSQVPAAVLPALRVLDPGARIVAIKTARDMFNQPLRKERSMAVVLMILATASLAIGLLGMISLLAMLLRSLQVELAVRYAVGATRRSIAGVLVRRMASPAGVGLLVATIPTAMGLFVLANMLDSASRAGLVGPVLALLAVAGACAAVCVQAGRKVLSANLMQWLRYE